jgi:hypothetical protein
MLDKCVNGVIGFCERIQVGLAIGVRMVIFASAGIPITCLKIG